MLDQEIRNLLRSAEAGLVDAPMDAARLAERVRARYRRGKQMRRMVGAVAPLVLLALAVAIWRIPWESSIEGGPKQPGGATVARADDIQRLIARADFHRRVARRIDALVRQDRALAEASPAAAVSDPQAEIREQLEIVAYRMILRADALRAAMEGPDEARGIYQDIVRLFPNTQSAELARRRLTDLGVFQGAT